MGTDILAELSLQVPLVSRTNLGIKSNSVENGLISVKCTLMIILTKLIYTYIQSNHRAQATSQKRILDKEEHP